MPWNLSCSPCAACCPPPPSSHRGPQPAWSLADPRHRPSPQGLRLDVVRTKLLHRLALKGRVRHLNCEPPGDSTTWFSIYGVHDRHKTPAALSAPALFRETEESREALTASIHKESCQETGVRGPRTGDPRPWGLKEHSRTAGLVGPPGLEGGGAGGGSLPAKGFLGVKGSPSPLLHTFSLFGGWGRP